MKKELFWATVWIVAVALTIASLADAHEMSPTYTADGKTICVADDAIVAPSSDGFIDNGDGTITQDGELMWRKNYMLPTDYHPSVTSMNWYTAQRLCDRRSFANYRDWRLPTIGELEKLGGVALFDNTPNKFWSGTNRYAMRPDSYSVYFYEYDLNRRNVVGKQTTGYTSRCVRDVK